MYRLLLGGSTLREVKHIYVSTDYRGGITGLIILARGEHLLEHQLMKTLCMRIQQLHTSRKSDKI